MIAIIKYNAGNVQSVQNALRRLGAEAVLTDDSDEIRAAERVIFPGVGEASSAMAFLKARGLDQVIKHLSQPVLGICLGQQLLCGELAEGHSQGLGIFDIPVKRFPPYELVPHMGWNNLKQTEGPLFNDFSAESHVYFVHSYYCELSRHTSAVCDYILPFSAALQKDNFFATQFHPEKSSAVGQRILQNFLELKL